MFTIQPLRTASNDEFNTTVKKACETNSWARLHPFLAIEVANTIYETVSLYHLDYHTLCEEWAKKPIDATTHPFIHFVVASVTLCSKFHHPDYRTTVRKSILQNVFLGLDKINLKYSEFKDYDLTKDLEEIVYVATRFNPGFGYRYDEESLSLDELLYLAGICEWLRPSAELHDKEDQISYRRKPVTDTPIRQRLREKLKKLAQENFKLFLLHFEKITIEAPSMTEYLLSFLDIYTREKIVVNFLTSNNILPHLLLHLPRDLAAVTFSYLGMGPSEVKVSTRDINILISNVWNVLADKISDFSSRYAVELRQSANKINSQRERTDGIFSREQIWIRTPEESLELLKKLVTLIETAKEKCRINAPTRSWFARMFCSSPTHKFIGSCNAALDVLPKGLLAVLRKPIAIKPTREIKL